MNYRVSYWAAIVTVVVTAVMAGAGLMTPARSGPFCASFGCVPAPYTDVAQFIPADYWWLIPGLLLIPAFVILVASIHAIASEQARTFTRVALAFAVGYAVVVGIDYFTQFAVVVPSLLASEAQSLSLFTQYNPHGFFIAAEAFGYLAMSGALLLLAPAFAGAGAERAVRWLLVGGFALTLGALVGLWLLAGDLIAFEVAVLSINWVVLIVSGGLLAALFRGTKEAPSLALT